VSFVIYFCDLKERKHEDDGSEFDGGVLRVVGECAGNDDDGKFE
jgi:hypothetical protein